MIVRKIGMIILVGIVAFLSACFPISIKRNEPPGIGAHAPDSGHVGDQVVLVLAISEIYRAGQWANLFKSRGVSRHVQLPMFVQEAELKNLSAKLYRHSVDTFFLGYFGNWTEKNDEHIVEVCVIWPDGRFLALGEPTNDKWQREHHGVIAMPWREQLLESLATAELFKTFSPPDACPYNDAKLNWDFDERRRVITFLNQAAVIQ